MLERFDFKKNNVQQKPVESAKQNFNSVNNVFLTTQQFQSAKIGPLKQVIATPIKIQSGDIDILSLSDKLMQRHGGTIYFKLKKNSF